MEGDSKEYLLPIASSERGNVHDFIQLGKSYKVSQYYDKHFNYYRVKNGTFVSSKKDVIMESLYHCSIIKKEKTSFKFFLRWVSTRSYKWGRVSEVDA